MNKKLYIIIIAAIIAVLAFWWQLSRRASVEAPLDTSDIDQNLEELEVNDLDKEFEGIDQELDTL
ncbi:MAG: hypothetical protein A2750_04290 [Candidatus Yanofskybacteria bacterium RIFCSPHIGHO2_01_FULL_45_42]|uniref:Uncharacterized protein n=2 Tax=Candidatus Yanofskyibacteriota TaxID=1752733 RepID=A0A1F8FKD0_9BACT|nr:MAG: hypothetical protein A2750_04290 [Candidatus Yanofskybacteria bacterium RIFCSPHIGHO2_01_FULL_45_42]OGN13481.1 MAG: hypothetical protein A3J47_03945 [Candidatus Yanofskybacteria bacterium RIFCSPHIGHO2_02_FULL_43_22]